MTITMRPRRITGVILLAVGSAVVLSGPDDRVTGIMLLGTLLGFVGVILGTTRDRFIPHALRQVGRSTWLHRDTCRCGRGTLYLYGRAALLRLTDER